MKTYLLPIFLSLSFFANAQFSLDNRYIDTIPCVGDESMEILKFTNWEFYQTLDNSWQGDRDVSRCINLKEIGEWNDQKLYGIDLSTIDITKALFFRYDNTEDEIFVEREILLAVFGNITSNQQMDIMFGEDCPDNMCSGLILQSLHSDPMFQDSLQKTTNFPFTDFSQCTVAACYASEKTENNQIVEVVYKLNMSPDTDVSTQLNFSGVDFEEPWSFIHTPEPSMLVSEDHNSGGEEYNAFLYELTEYADNYFFTHQQDGLPSVENIQLYEFDLEENTPEPKTFNVIIEEYQSISFQSNVQLIGGLTSANDDTRHNLNLINNSLDMCIAFVELIFEEGTNLVQQGGQINFSDDQACLQFRQGSSLVIDQDVKFNYGIEGLGLINMRSGSSFQLRKGSELLFDGKMVLSPKDVKEGREDVFVKLTPGTSLSFSEYARIVSFGDLKLDVYMLGGHLDISKLSSEDQDKINIIYPSDEDPIHHFSVWPNPVEDYASIYNPEKLDIEKIEIYDAQGMLVSHSTLRSDELYVSLDFSMLENQVYFLKIYHKEGIETKRVVTKN